VKYEAILFELRLVQKVVELESPKPIIEIDSPVLGRQMHNLIVPVVLKSPTVDRLDENSP
jgi:hypothetical protein